MSETPRLRSAFPSTPRTDLRARPSQNGRTSFSSLSSSGPSKPSPVTKPLQRTAPVRASNTGPLIPLDVIDAPTQRFYAAAIYIALFAWRVYAAVNVTNELDSTWQFLVWLLVDGAYFTLLTSAGIPWLEWSYFSTLTIWILHAILNFFLMYQIPIPVLSWLAAIVKVAYDRELAISEHRVKPADVLHNSSIILGKQIIQILPEGSAILNPDKLSFCLDSTTTSIDLPIRINQTNPISLELTRFDIDTDEQEHIVVSQKQAKKLRQEAEKAHSKSDKTLTRTLRFPVSKKGLYRLTRVIDETKLEVRRRSYDVAVVSCPTAFVSVDAKDKCAGDLSGIALHLEGVPPFKVKYSKKINQQTPSSIIQTVQPSEPGSEASEDSSGVVLDPKHPQMGWTQSKTVQVDINESLIEHGSWSYQVDEVEDGLGNHVKLSLAKAKKSSNEVYSETFTVHRRPTISLNGCDSQKPIRVREGQSRALPVRVGAHGKLPSSDWPLKLKYTFVPATETDDASSEEFAVLMTSENELPSISKPGTYSLESIETQFCAGDVSEPSSCSLYNPPRPDVSIDSEEVRDSCGDAPIGMVVNFDFTGSPPFIVTYSKTHMGRTHSTTEKFSKMRGSINIREQEAGQYVYRILEIKDQFYEPVSLKDRGLVLTQTIKPAAVAEFRDSVSLPKQCLGQTVSVPVVFRGEGPWDLDYEIVHGSKRKKFNIHSEEDSVDIVLPELNKGGKYSLVLTGVQDSSRCRKVLDAERQIEVRAEKPHAAFGDIEGRRHIKSREHEKVSLPLRLKGVAPWEVKIRNLDENSEPRRYVLKDANGKIEASRPGTYEIVSVQDSCYGDVDPKANKFTLSWIPRPDLLVRDPTVEGTGSTLRKAPVCQGYEDSLSLALTGSPPYHLTYEQKSNPVKGQGQRTIRGDKAISVATGSAIIKMDTSKAGEYTYSFTALEDDHYKHDKRHFTPVVVHQEVFALPSAQFKDANKVYTFCKEDPAFAADEENEIIPIALTGTPPFSLEVAVTYHGSSQRPEIKRINDIASHSYAWPLSRSRFDLGTHSLQIRSVKDSRGCESLFDNKPSSVRIQVSSPPTISPLQSATDFCVGDYVTFSLSGQAPFDVDYTFQGANRKARVTSHEFKRISHAPGDFVITGISDSAMGSGKCRARKDIRKVIHPYPSVRIERGETKTDDIHEGGEVDIHFEFTGTPPFEFTYTRSENLNHKKSHRSQKPAILETRHDSSNDFMKIVRATEEGTYEVVAIKDRYCAYSAAGGAGGNSKKNDQKMLRN